MPVRRRDCRLSGLCIILTQKPAECGVSAPAVRGRVARKPMPCYADRDRRPPKHRGFVPPATMTAHSGQNNEDLWVFAYGSLMWRPGFAFLERRNARLVGAHRALCVYSFVHRGTPEKPGLVFGLDRGGNCRGIAYRVASNRSLKTIEYLRAREQVTRVYREAWRRVWLD